MGGRVRHVCVHLEHLPESGWVYEASLSGLGSSFRGPADTNNQALDCQDLYCKIMG